MLKKRNLVFLLALQTLWLLTLVALVAWWSFFLLQQNYQIEDLSKKLHQLDPQNQSTSWIASKSMILGEGLTFMSLIVLMALLFFSLTWREIRRSRAMQRFFASYAHELRNPLASLRLQAELVAESLGAGKSPRPEALRRILDDSVRLEFQVERSLELARAEAGGALHSREIRLKAFVDQMIGAWTDPSHKDMCFHFDCAVPDILVFADPNALQLVFRNIFENIKKHGRVENVRVFLSAEVVGKNFVEMTISDNGKGFPGRASKLGTLFYRGSESSGAGVGLYLIRLLIRRMGGDVRFLAHPHFSVCMKLKKVEV